MKYQPAMWNRPNITTSPLRPGEPSSCSRAIARSQLARCESNAALLTPVDPLVRKIAHGSSELPTRGCAVVAAPWSQSAVVVTTGTPSGEVIERAASSCVWCVTTTRGRRYSTALAASDSVKPGLIGASAAPSFVTP